MEKVGWNENSRLEDYEMYLKLAELGDFAYDPQILAAWRKHSYNTSKDKLLMLREVLEAQRRNFGVFNVTEKELQKAQTKTKFLYARDLLQHGEKLAALKLGLKNLEGSNSFIETAKFFVRFLVPMSVVGAKRNLRKNRYSEKSFIN